MMFPVAGPRLPNQPSCFLFRPRSIFFRRIIIWSIRNILRQPLLGRRPSGSENSMRIAMIGAGYVGVTTAACLAELGHELVCYEIDTERVARLSAGELPFFEPGLAEMMRAQMGRGRLTFTASLENAAANAEAVFIAVGTPSAADGDIDLSFVEAAAAQLAPHLPHGAVVVIKSTVSAGTARMIRELIAEERRALDVSVASNPEFLREGSAIADFMEPDRIVIGCDDPHSEALLREVYRPLVDRGAPLLATSSCNAELIKHAANALLAVKIGFVNDVADLCEAVGADALAVAEGIGLDRRIGKAFLMPGPGYGGSCFPKDTRAFAAIGRRNGAPQALVETLAERNERRKAAIARRIVSRAGLTRGSVVAVLGLAFKANTDDVRESAALTIIETLQRQGVRVRAHDPQARHTAARHLRDVTFCACPYEALKGADAVAVLTEWPEYRELDAARMAEAMAGDRVFDFRNILDPVPMAAAGLVLQRVGNGTDERVRAPQRQHVPGAGVLDRRVAAPRDL